MKPTKSRPSSPHRPKQRPTEPQLPTARPLPSRDVRPNRLPPRRPAPNPAGSCLRLLEEDRWSALVARHSPRLRASIRAALWRAGIEPRPEDVEEIVQETYCRLLVCGRLSSERGEGSELAGFLAKMGERLAFDRVRRERVSSGFAGKRNPAGRDQAIFWYC